MGSEAERKRKREGERERELGWSGSEVGREGPGWVDEEVRGRLAS